jgi:hypothetical protein
MKVRIKILHLDPQQEYPIKPNITPHCVKQPYSIPQSREAEVKATVAQLEEAGILMRTQ